MNEKFFSLPAEKQQAILNAGYHVFARNSYKKSPMSEIAEAAGISKALLFHYFYNKKELYLYLLDTCAKVTNRALEESGCYEEDDLFEILYLGIQVKINIMRQYPDMGFFSMMKENIDWDTVSSNVDFAIIRCGYGDDQTDQDDEKWTRNVEACERLGIPYGVYIYSYALTDEQALSEAQHAIRLLQGHSPALPVYENYWNCDPDEANYMITLDDSPIGWIKLNGLLEKNTLWLSMLVIHPDHQGKHYGEMALHWVERFAKEKACPYVGIQTTVDNCSAVALYVKAGYRMELTKPDGDRYVFTKDISYSNEQ